MQMNSYFVHVYNRSTNRKHFVKVSAPEELVACRTVLAQINAPECIACVERAARSVA